MSAEWWGEPADQRIRSASCGHVFPKDQLPPPGVIYGNDICLCPVCGLGQHATRADMLALRDGVPASSSAWGEAGCRLRIQLADRRGPERSVANVGALLVRMSSPKTSRIDLPGRHLSLKPALLHRGPTSTLVLHARPSGCVIRGGGITLPPATVLILRGPGAAFEGVSFYGGMVVCCGEACTVRFTGCVFEGCQVYSVHGAAVTARRCTHRGCPAQIAAVASGEGSRLHLHACTFRHCLNAITVERAGTVSAAECLVSSVHAVIVRGAGSRASFHRCTIVGRTSGFGFMVTGGAVHMRHCSVGNVLRGIIAGEGSVVEVHHSHLESGMSAASVKEAARVLLRESDALLLKPHAEANNTPHLQCAAVDVCGQHGDSRMQRPSVQIERCSVRSRASMRAGVAVSSGSVSMSMSKVISSTAAAGVAAERADARVVLQSCEVHSIEGRGCDAYGTGCRIDIRSGRVVGGQGACFADARAEVTAWSAWLCGARPAGPGAEQLVTVVNGAVAVLLCCTLRYGLVGVTVSDARAVVKQCLVSHMLRRDGESDDACGPRSGGASAAAGQGYQAWGGELVVEGGSVQECVDGAVVTSPGALHGSARLAGVCFTDNLRALHVGGGSKVDVERCQMRLWERQADFPAEGDVACADDEQRRDVVAVRLDSQSIRATFEACTFVGYGHCICSEGCQDLAIARCSFRAGCEGTALIELLSSRGALVEGCDFSGTADAVKIDALLVENRSDGSAPVGPVQSTVKGCRFHSGIQTALAVLNSADAEGRVEAIACTFEGCAEAIGANTGVSLVVDDCDFASVAAAIVARAASSVTVRRCVMVCTGDAVTAICERGGSACLTLADCHITGMADRDINGTAAMKLYAGVNAVLKECSVKRFVFGVAALPGASVKVRESEFVECDLGVMVGSDKSADPDLWLEDEEAAGSPVPECGTGRSDGSPQRAPPSVCEGAVAGVGMHGVDLVKCGYGVMVQCSGRLTSRRVHAKWCIAPFSAIHDCHACSFEDCEVVGGVSIRPGVTLVEVLESEVKLRRLEVVEVPGISARVVAGSEDAVPTTGNLDELFAPQCGNV